MLSVMPLCSLVLPGLLVLGQADRTTAPPTRNALVLWQEGQEAMKRGDIPSALRFYQESRALCPDLARVELSLAAAHLQADDQPNACGHLRRYLELEPGHWQVRQQLADLLARLGHRALACRELELMLHGAQNALGSQQNAEDESLTLTHLIHGHGRLMQLAEEENQVGRYHLHRGLGLYYLAKSMPAESGLQKVSTPQAKANEDLPDRQDLLLKAVKELTEASQKSPGDAKSAWYLSLAWRELGQPAQAEHWLKILAKNHVPGELHPKEEREFALARGSTKLDRLLSGR